MKHTGLYISPLAKGKLVEGGKLSLIPVNKHSQALVEVNSFDEKPNELDAHRITEYSVLDLKIK